MPPSTVFSYWRRRSNASPVPPASQPTLKVLGTSSPQLPLIADSTTLTANFDEKFTTGDGPILQTPTDLFSNFDGGKATLSVSTIDAPSSSTTTPTVEPSSSEDHPRPESSPDDRDRELSVLASQSIPSKPSFTPVTPDQTNGGSSKPGSPFRPSSGIGSSNPQAVDSQPKRSTSPAMAPSSHRRFRTSPDESPGDKVSRSQREHRFEGPISRRPGDRDVQPVEHVPQRSGKTMLHLLNPMSLLAKRRAHQMAGLRAEDVNKGSRNLVPAIPDDYDPRIRGSIVHDFSAPRPRRHLSTAPVPRHEQASQPSPSSGTQHGYASIEANARVNDAGSTLTPLSEQGKKHSDHSPVFREHFEDDKRALQVENKAYLQSSLLTDPANRDRDPHAIPVFARKLPSSITNDLPPDEQSKPSPRVDAAADDAIREEEEEDTVEIGPPHQLSGLLKHFKSNASRFSFDMNGVGSSTQEKLLEEKHKEKEAARKAQARLDGEISDGDDDYDNDLFEDLDGLEEGIPGVNMDADEDDEFRDFSGPGNILNKSWLAPNLSPVIASPVHPPEMPNLQDDQLPPPKQEEPEPSTAFITQSASILVDGDQESSMTFFRESKDLSSAPLQTIPDDDDLYFDDGEFDELNTEGAGDEFDESIFDDPTSHLYERKQPIKSVAAVQPETEESALDTDSEDGLKHVPSIASQYHQGFALRRYGSVAGNIPNPEIVKSHGGVLSEHNLEAFRHALADAANEEATKGHLGYPTSVSERSLGQESGTYTVDSQPGLVSDESRLSQVVDPISSDEVFDDFNYDDDESLFDDPIIAAANAEALENDDEGFYGQEFGFYAQAYGDGSELTNGGYFGHRGVEGISRSHSGRGKFREPSLTPITERSEWSTRNSIISVNAHGVAHSNQSVPSPGLAQLVDMGSLDDELSLGALMKLRRDAWGGSNGSLRSSSASPPPQQHTASNRGSFAFSDVSPSVHTVPPDFLGGPSVIDSPIRESDKAAWAYSLPTQRIERPTTRDEDSQI
ncbi:hypothetical protein BDW59DRAFT_148172 [Aspergillus cavernicola]|uniref:Uncharacterized protein n=1 Tax=Aspergillus cavernicola TaxID=176166 RepID=A0ABR4I818_9EURO